jgi:hypothetical protein
MESREILVEIDSEKVQSTLSSINGIRVTFYDLVEIVFCF